LRFTVWEDELYPEQNVVVDLPLTDKIASLKDLSTDLGFPDYVDTNYFPLKRAIVTLWAAKHAHELHEMFPETSERVAKHPITMLLFGGAAFRVRCPSCNAPGSPFNRPINDVDFVIMRRDHRDVRRLLLQLANICGTQYMHFMTHHDKRFTSLQAGNRILLRAVGQIRNDGVPVIAALDILSEKIEMRHTIDVKDDFKSAHENMFTLSLVSLLLTKTQFIFDMDRGMEEGLQRAGEAYRVLPHAFYRNDRLLVGMERKDFLDVAALLLDHELGDGPDRLDIEALANRLRKNEKLALTARLNIENMLSNMEMIRNLGATSSQVDTIERHLRAILERIPVVDKRWSKAWWRTDIETPHIPFSATP